MGLRITTNVQAINSRRHMSNMNDKVSKAMAELSSGDRINKAADDAAGLSISERIKSIVRGIRQTQRNANDGISMIQTAEGGLNEIANIMIRLRELAVQAASDTVGETERGFIQKEVAQLKNEVDRIANVTTWGKTKLLSGTGDLLEFQVGVYNDEFEDRINFDPAENNATLSALDLEGIDFSDKGGAQEALEPLDQALTKVNEMRATIGAIDTRLHHALENMLIYDENMSAAKSRIRDTDVADATSRLASNQILLNANVSNMAQANGLKSVALKLIS